MLVDVVLRRSMQRVVAPHLRGLSPGQHSSEEMSRRWRAACDTVPIWPAQESNPRLLAPTACA